MRTHGTPEQRREQRDQVRRARQVQHLRAWATGATNGHDLVVAATQAAKAVSRRVTEVARRRLAQAIADAAQAADVPDNWKDRP